MNFDNNYVTVDLDILAANFRAVREQAGVPVMAVIKADGYGHGAVPIAQLLKKDCGFFGVATIAEALELRNTGITNPILVLSPMPSVAFETAVKQNIRPTISRYEDALTLSECAKKLGKDAPFHLAVDTGMSRIGFQATEQDANICAELCRLPGLVPEGLFSHFATADCENLDRAKAQAEKFQAFDQMLKDRGISIPLRHLDNSAGILNFDTHYEMVRAGIILYGLHPSREVYHNLPLQPSLSWYSRVAHIKTLEAGREISYGGTYVTSAPTMVATVPVGYADGYMRALSNKFYVLIKGQPAPILGRVCMDQLMVDVTSIPNVTVGDRVVLLGKDGDRTITAEEIGEAAGSFNYEFVCGIGKRVPRYYLQDGRTVQQVHYLLDG